MKQNRIAKLASIVALAGIATLGATSFVPVEATTFTPAKLIYLVNGVVDNSSLSIGTSVPCTNQSRLTATVRWIFHDAGGVVKSSYATSISAGQTVYVATLNGVAIYAEVQVGGANYQGNVAIYSTQSEVFCSALVGPSSNTSVPGSLLHMIRFNEHPGVVE